MKSDYCLCADLRRYFGWNCRVDSMLEKMTESEFNDRLKQLFTTGNIKDDRKVPAAEEGVKLVQNER